MLLGVKGCKAEWARSSVSEAIITLSNQLRESWGVNHWSRKFEYPWVLLNGNFKPGEIIFDAAGGNSQLQYLMANSNLVLNVDLNQDYLGEAEKNFGHLSQAKNVFHEVGDLRALRFPDCFCSKITCVSVLEHIENPMQVIRELWRILARGGRLLVTFDVASYVRWNHTIDIRKAAEILEMFGENHPFAPSDVLQASFPEIDQVKVTGEIVPAQPFQSVQLSVMCFYADKE